MRKYLCVAIEEVDLKFNKNLTKVGATQLCKLRLFDILKVNVMKLMTLTFKMCILTYLKKIKIDQVTCVQTILVNLLGLFYSPIRSNKYVPVNDHYMVPFNTHIKLSLPMCEPSGRSAGGSCYHPSGVQRF